MTINLKTAAALILPDITTISCTHEGTSTPYIYKVSRDLAEDLMPGDLILVKNSRHLTTGVVVEVHEEPLLDVESTMNYCWAFQKVDMDELNRLNTRDGELLRKIKEVQNRTTRSSLLASLGITDEKALLKSFAHFSAEADLEFWHGISFHFGRAPSR